MGKKNWLYGLASVFFLILFVFVTRNVFETTMEIKQESEVLGEGNYYGSMGTFSLFHLSLSVILFFYLFLQL
jgi:hypothetical protein